MSARSVEFIEAKEGDVEVSMEQSVTDRWSIAAGTGLGHVHLHGADINEAMRFYRDALGFEELNLLPALRMGDVNVPGHVPHFIAFNTWAK